MIVSALCKSLQDQSQQCRVAGILKNNKNVILQECQLDMCLPMVLCFNFLVVTSRVGSLLDDLDIDAAAAPIDMSLAPLDVLTKILESMCDKDRFACALVCKAWAKAAAAATRIVTISRPTAQTFNCVQQWLLKHGDQVVGLQLCTFSGAALTSLPCAQLQHLVLVGDFEDGSSFIGSRVWGDIAAATKLTSVSMEALQTASQQANVVSALTALRDLKQLSWRDVQCSGEQQLSDSLLLQQLTKLTALTLRDVSAAAVEHLGSLTKLQCLSLSGVSPAAFWAAAGCPGLQELKALTRLQLLCSVEDIPASVCQLTGLRELDVWQATPTALNRLQALTGFTQLKVRQLRGLSVESPPLQLPGLQHLELTDWVGLGCMPMSFLASCRQLRVLDVLGVKLRGPGSLVASTMLQQLALDSCSLSAADGVAGGPVSWQQVFPGPGRLPHLTSLQLPCVQPDLQQADVEHLACCSSLQVLHLEQAGDEQCGALTKLTQLRKLTVQRPNEVSIAGLRQLAALEQLTSLGFLWWPSRVSRVLQAHMSDRLSGYTHAIINQAPAGHPSNVPARLLRMCDLAAAGDS